MKIKLLFIICLCSTISFYTNSSVSKTLNLSAGALSSSLTTDEKNSITNLTLTCTIDARDFKTMREIEVGSLVSVFE